MLDAIVNAWTTLRAMNFYLEITVAAFALYFWGRVSKLDNRIAVLLPIVACALGQLGFGMQHAQQAKQQFGPDDYVMAAFWTLLQAGLSFMIFTVFEKYGVIDKVMSKFLTDKGLDGQAVKP